MVGKPDLFYGSGRKKITAFSLVEVVIAISLLAFALIVIIGLLPMGLKSNRDSIEESQAVNLLQALVADRQASYYTSNSFLYNIPAITNTSPTSGIFYVMEDIASTNSSPTSAFYRVSYTMYPATNIYLSATNCLISGPAQPVMINFRVSWPAAQTNQASSVETLTTFMQQ